MSEETGRGGWRRSIEAATYGALALVVFTGLPEAARWANGGAFAQSAPAPLVPPNGNGGIIAPGNQGIITQGQTGNNTLVAPQYAQIGRQTVDQLKALIPVGSHVNVSTVMQDPATMQMGEKMVSLLKQLDYDVDPLVSATFPGQSFKGFQVMKNGDKDYIVLIGDTRIN